MGKEIARFSNIDTVLQSYAHPPSHTHEYKIPLQKIKSHIRIYHFPNF